MLKLRLLALLLIFTSASADTEIHRCLQEDGTTAFQETPCAEPVEEPESEAAPDGNEPEADHGLDDFEPVSQIAVDEPLPRPASTDRTACVKAARDAIDAIDLEMRAGNYSSEELENFKAELRVLTRQLRACKQL